jgi:cell division transport system permease protein
MKAFRILNRNIRDSFKSVFRNFALSIASISCITITLLVVSLAIILTLNVNNFASLVEKDVTIVAFLKTDITDEEKNITEDNINALTNIESIAYQSKKDIADDMAKESETLKNILASYTDEENPLQPTFLVKVTDINQIGKTAKEIEKIDNISVVKYGEGMVEQLVSVFVVLKNGSIVLVFALIIVTAFLITNTIKITIFSRKREIDIMRLVGASNINIKIPFIFEGLLLGIIGSITPILITIYGYTALFNKFGGQLFSKIISLIKPNPFVYLVAILLLVIGMIVGMFGSSRAVKKYLKI